MNQLSEHFSESELDVVGCTPAIKAAALMLCVMVLEPIRGHFEKRMRVTSGYRNEVHNRATGGAATSYHLYIGGEAAADFDIPGEPPEDVFDWVRLHSGLPIDQVILEYTHGIADVIHVQIHLDRPPRYMALIGETHGNLPGKKKKYRVVEYRLPERNA